MNLLKLFTTNTKNPKNEPQFDPDSFHCYVKFWNKHEPEIKALMQDMEESEGLKGGCGRASCMIHTEEDNPSDPTAQLVLAKAPHKKGGKYHKVGYIPKAMKEQLLLCKPYVKEGKRYFRLWLESSLMDGVTMEITCPESQYYAGL